MKQLILLLSAAFWLTGCKTFTGTFSVYKQTSLMVETDADDCFDWDWDCEPDIVIKPISVAPGNFRAEMKVQSKSAIHLLFKDATGKKVEAKFKVPKGTKLPSYDGDFSISARDAGQNYDIVGSVDTQVTRTGSQRGWESCTYTRERRVCRRVNSDDKRPQRGDRRRPGRGRKECYWETETVWGEQEVEYHYRTENTDVLVNLMVPNSRSTTAKFNGNYSSTDKVYDYQGTCR